MDKAIDITENLAHFAKHKPYSLSLTLSQLLEQQALKAPSKLALIFQDEQITYEALHQRINKLSHFLHKKGVTRNSVVAVYLPRSIELVIILTAIVKAGGAYLPIDIKQPFLRVHSILEDADPSICIMPKELISQFKKSKLSTELLAAESITHQAKEYPAISLMNINQPEDLAYIIYTSGSTGKPKGVANIQKGIVNRLLWMQNQFELTCKDRVLQKTSISFDVAVWEFWWPLITGACLVLASEDAEKEATILYKDISRYKITVMHFVPSQLAAFLSTKKLAKCESLRLVISSGEALTSQLCHHFFSHSNAELFNLYGPTEASIDVSFYKCGAHNLVTSLVPIGKPITNTNLYVIDENKNVLSYHQEGELCITGMGLAQGYWKNPSLTKEKFIELSISSTKRIRAYKTGDLAVQREDGNFEFIGRMDEQIKLRGFRIEPAEIEAILLKHPAITQAAIKAVDTPAGTKALIGYLVIKENRQLPKDAELTSFLANRLPDYMIPHHWITLEALPLTLSGKLDKKALPLPAWEEKLPFYLPRNEIENKLVHLWQKVLNIKSIDIHHNYFALGGDSLSAIIIASLASKENINLRAQSIMLYPTIASLANYLLKEANSLPSPNYASIFTDEIYQARMKQLLISEGTITDTSNIEAIYPATPMQQGMIFHTLQSPNIGMYLNHMTFRLTGILNEFFFYETWKKLLQKYAILRTGFYFTEFNLTYQVINRTASLRYFFKNIIECSVDKQQLLIEDYITNLRSKGFSLNTPPLWEIALFKITENTYQMIYTDHHIINDGISQGQLFKDFMNMYCANYNKEALQSFESVPFINYCDWLYQQDKVSAEIYWAKLLKPIEEPTILDIDNNNNPTAKLNTVSREYIKITSKKLTKKLAYFSKHYQITVNSVIQTAWAILISKYCRECPLVYGLIESGRAINLDKANEYAGPLVQTYPIVIELATNINVLQLIRNLQQQTISSSQHSYYPLTEMHPLTSLAKQIPLFRYAITFLDDTVEQLFSSSLELENIKVTYLTQSNQTHYPLLIIISKVEEHITFRFSYNAEHFTDKDIKLLSKRWLLILEEMTKDATRLVKDVPVVLKEEKSKILYEWNNTFADFPTDKTIVQLFEQQVQINSNKIAIIFNDEKITYKSLNQQANQLAHYLRKVGVKPEVIVAIYLERSPQYIISMLAISKAGGVYLPIDKQLPAGRINYLLSDSKATLLISHRSLYDKLDSCLSSQEQDRWQGKPIYLDTDKNIYIQSTDNLPPLHTSQNAIYIMYTSGSTGNPKGVVVEHSAFTNCLFAIQEKIKLEKNDRWLALTSFSFDIAQSEIHLSFICGATIFLANDLQRIEPLSIQNIINNFPISILQITPYFLESLLELSWNKSKFSLKIICGGEKLSTQLANKLKLVSTQAWNFYGPTETTIWCTAYKLTKENWNSIPIGKPLANCQAYILDNNFKLLPKGAVGELYLGGSNLARGYVNQPTLTLEKFITAPFLENAKKRLYKTGDLACWLPDGNLEYKGRIDEQIKIRGLRIEPREIENVLIKLPFIKNAKVIAQENSSYEKNSKQLIAYLIAHDNAFEWYNPHDNIQSLSQWLEIYNTVYENVIPNIKFNIAGWKNSYTGKLYSIEEMKEWRDNTVKRILNLNPKKILEIGCGSGLLLFSLAPCCKEYFATDFSQGALSLITRQLKKETYHTYVKVKQCAANKINTLKERYYDTVIINSVIQYFPNEKYLREVIHQAIERIQSGGQLFIGDVRNLESLELFHTALQLSRANNNTTLRELYSLVLKGVQQDKELTVSPQFFYLLKKMEKRISSVEIQIKEGKYETEMNQFRYDVILHIEKSTEVPKLNWIDWEDIRTLENLKAYLKNTNKEAIAIRKIPNARTSGLKDIYMQLEKCGNKLNDWEYYIQKQKSLGIEIDNLIEAGKKFNLESYLTFHSTSPQFLDIVFFNKNKLKFSQLSNAICQEKKRSKDFVNFANNLLLNNTLTQLNETIFKKLQNHLPNYMIPSTLIWLDNFPLTINGKLDKNRLPQFQEIKADASEMVSPKNEMQIQLLNIWKKVLKVKELCINDNFFGLGGHSLLVLQVTNQISKLFNINFPITALYQAPTITQLEILISDILTNQSETLLV